MNRKLQKECESGCEYILPDYMGDIKKLLSGNAKAVPTGKFVGEGSVEVSGSIEYELLYLDNEGKLTAVNTSSDFTENFAIDGERYLDSAEESKVSLLRVRVTGPRKISMKADVETVLTVTEENEITVGGDVFSDENRAVEKCSVNVSFATSIFAVSGEREYAEIAEKLEGVFADDVEVVCVHATSKVTDAVSGDGEVTVKGENIVSAILSLPERAPMRIKKAIPFEEVIVVEDAKPEMTAVASGFVSSADIGFGSDGEYLNAVANIIAEYRVELIQNADADVVTDAYTVDSECRTKYTDAQFSKILYAGTQSFSVDVKCDKNQERLSELSEVLSVGAELRPASANIVQGGCEFLGEVTVSGVGYETNVDGSISYIPIKLQDEFAKKVNINCQIPEKCTLDYDLKVDDLEIINDSDVLTVRCFISAGIYLSEQSSVRILTSCESAEGEGVARDASVITVYYPKRGEKLFDVAKKYKTTSTKIAKDNALADSVLASYDSPDSLVGVKKLIIR